MPTRNDYSDILSQKKREVYIGVSISKDAIQNRKALIKQQGFNSGFMEQIAKRGLDAVIFEKSKTSTLQIYGSGTALLATIRISGYTYNALTPTELLAFKNALASQYGVDPNTIELVLRSGSLVMDISVIYNKIAFGELTTSDLAFFANSQSIISSMNLYTLTQCISSANVSSKIASTGDPISVSVAIPSSIVLPNGDINLQLINDSKNKLANQDKNFTNFPYPFVGDSINNCMYTIIFGLSTSAVVRINQNGTMDKICDFPTNKGSNHIFINSQSTYLICQSNVITTENRALTINSQSYDRIFLVNILTGTINTIMLNDLALVGGPIGFDVLTRKFYYGSNMKDNNKYTKLCYVTIPSNYESTTLTATYYSNISVGDQIKIEFINSNVAFMLDAFQIFKLDFSVANGAISVIAGGGEGNLKGGWSNNNSRWDEATHFGPFLDNPIGTKAFFSFCTDIAYDSVFNQLLICDQSAQRIRSVDLDANNNYYTKTSAGTSPLITGLASNDSNTLGEKGNYSQTVLNSLNQVGNWGTGNMGPYIKINKTYQTSTFNNPTNVVIFNNTIYVRQQDNLVRQLATSGYVSDFSVIKTFPENSASTLQIYGNNKELVATIRISGYTYGTLTPAQLLAFKNALASEYSVDPSLISLVLTSGSLVMEVSVDYTKAVLESLTTNDKAFFTNMDAVIHNMDNSIVTRVVTNAGVGLNIVSTGGTPDIGIIVNPTIKPPNGDISLQIIDDCKKELTKNNKIAKQIPYPLIADPIHNCMYTIIDGILVRITTNGVLEEIGIYSSSFPFGYRFIFINSAATHLIIPKFDSVSASANNNTVYLIGIFTRQIKEITLSDTDDTGTYGFDKTNNRLYYTTTSSHPTNRYELCYITISSYTTNSTLSATFGFSSISANESLNYKGKIEFISPTTAFVSSIHGITELDLAPFPSTKAVIAGEERERNLSGYWKNNNNTGWYSSFLIGGPYLDGSGTNAFFSWITDIAFDSENNRLLVCDSLAHRIRSIALSGTYNVTTIAGTSPIKTSVADSINSSQYTSSTLNSLGQIGAWNNGKNDMPIFEKKNKSYLLSTFRYPINCVIFSNKIYVRTLDNFQYDNLLALPANITNPYDYCTTRQLSNGKVSDFTVIKT